MRRSTRSAVRRPACRPRVEELESRLTPTTLPTGFTEELVTTASPLSRPTAMSFSPTGQLWVIEQGGAVKLVRDNGTTHTALSLTVDDEGERGLLGITFDPTYNGAAAGTDYVYIYYTVPRADADSPAHNRLSRFTVSGAGTTTPTLGSELVLRDLPPEDEDNNLATDGDTNHNGGAIHFGPDGKLYVAVGDHNYDTADLASHVSQDVTLPFGKLLRLNKNGTNPTDNPFYDGSSSNWQGAVWALGLRNPYTFAFDPGSSRVYINDVGESEWEEINAGAAGANYGWSGSFSPRYEGFESSVPWDNYRDPVMAYDHSDSGPTPEGCAITGGVFYPAGGQFGSAYAGKYFFADFCGGFIRVFDPADPGSASTPDTSAAFASDLTGGQPVDLDVDANGNLYYLSLGDGAIYRISFLDFAEVMRGDFDGDGQQDVAGFTNDGRWFVSLATPDPATSFAANTLWADWASVGSWSQLLVGDFTGDGKDDVAGFSHVGGWWVGASDGTGFTTTKWAQWASGSRSWASLHVGDFTGDGKDDVAAFAHNGGWWVGVSDGSDFMTTRWAAWASGSASWAELFVGDFTGDGKDDVAAFSHMGGWWVGASDGDSFMTTKWAQWASGSASWAGLFVGDFNGDGKDDVAGFVHNGNWWVGTSDGNDFMTTKWTANAWSMSSSWAMLTVGDFDGDGKDDVAGFANNGHWWVGLSDGDSFQVSRWTANPWSPIGSWAALIVGDYNGDDKDDIAAFANNFAWWVGASDGDSLNVSRWATW